MAHLVYGAPYVPDDAQLSDLSVLMKHLLSVAAHMRGTTDGAGVARRLEAAAQALQQQSAEAKVQRGLAVASQTLASQLALKCEQVQQQQQSGGRGYAPHGGVQHSQGGGHMHSSGGGGHDGPSAITAAAVGTPGGARKAASAPHSQMAAMEVTRMLSMMSSRSPRTCGALARSNARGRSEGAEFYEINSKIAEQWPPTGGRGVERAPPEQVGYADPLRRTISY